MSALQSVDWLIRQFSINLDANDLQPMDLTVISKSMLSAYSKVISFALSLDKYSWDGLQEYKHRVLIKDIRVGDKIDYYQPSMDDHDHHWLIGEVIKIYHNKLKILPHSLYQYRHNKYIIHFTDKASNSQYQIQKLNTYSAYHTYLDNPAFEICKGLKRIGWWGERSQAKECSNCLKLCCTQCSLILINDDNIDDESLCEYECAECNDKKQYNQLLEAILSAFDANYGYPLFDMNILHIIVEFGIGFIIKCEYYDKCGNDVPFKNEIEMNFQIDSNGNKVKLTTKAQISDVKHGAMMNSMFDDPDSDATGSSQDSNDEYRMDGQSYNELMEVICNTCKWRM